MNAKQRRKALRKSIADAPICPECGEKGRHWISPDESALLYVKRKSGFWICKKFYGSDGRRLVP